VNYLNGKNEEITLTLAKALHQKINIDSDIITSLGSGQLYCHEPIKLFNRLIANYSLLLSKAKVIY